MYNHSLSQESQPCFKVSRVHVKPTRKSNSSVTMELMNLKLFLENHQMMDENERLRQKALFLHQENQNLLSEMKKKQLKLSCEH
ncbi:hypothetical protein QJS10_CPB20g01561 [Acorus calamus]|uniref:Uncharacterized protein n=1 Tax=Acorus calamus TaxID=4465 RepID=A0AAV9CE18_ACOCL|nr:hypothetical protein QJS10_CPB20g01561 [Acorus calamus]